MTTAIAILPSQTIPVVDPNTGRMNDLWYQALRRLQIITEPGINTQPFNIKLTQISNLQTSGFLAYANGKIQTHTFTGVDNRITITSGDGSRENPVIDISEGYQGQESIQTLGTITSGIWNSNPIDPKFGGTGVSNDSASTFTLAGAYPLTINLSGATNVTLPTSGTLLAVVIGASANEVLVTDSLGNAIWSNSLPQAVINNITQLTTIVSGTWNGSLIRADFGGTTQNNGADAQMNFIHSTINFPSNSTMTFSISSGSTSNVAFPTSGTLLTATDVPNPLTLARGTGANITANAGSVVYSGASTFAVNTPVATNNNPLLSQGGNAPIYAAFTMSNGCNQGDFIYASANNVYSNLAKNTNATRYIANTGTSNNPAWDQINLSNGVTNTLPVANGGTGDSTLTAYAVLCGGTTSTGAIQSIAALGSSGQVLTSNGAAALPTFQASGGGSSSPELFVLSQCGGM